MTPSELIAYYVGLLIMQYNLKPKAQATIQTLVDAVVANLVIQQVENGFDIPTAVGAQLDILAKYVGAARTIFGIDLTNNYFQFRFAADAPPPTTTWNGFATASNPITTWFWLSVVNFDAIEYILTDGQLRNLILYLAQLESMDFTVENIDNLFFEFFGTYVTWVDGFNMTMTITHDLTHDPNTLFEIVKSINAFPRPGGVQLIVVET